MRCACDIRGISSLKEKQVEAITALMRERDVFVCLPTGSISRCAMHSYRYANPGRRARNVDS